jgi:hypothetical protein
MPGDDLDDGQGDDHRPDRGHLVGLGHAQVDAERGHGEQPRELAGAQV